MSMARRALVALLFLVPAAPAHAADRVVFSKNVLPLARATDLGKAPADRVMEIDLGLRHPDPAGEAALAAAQRDPASADHRRLLPRAQYGTGSGVPAATLQKTLDWLKAGGATVQTPSPSRDYVEVSATVAQADKLFQTEIHSYGARGTSFIANRYAPSVPA